MHEQGGLGMRQRRRGPHEHLASSERGVLARPRGNRIYHDSYITRQYLLGAAYPPAVQNCGVTWAIRLTRHRLTPPPRHLPGVRQPRSTGPAAGPASRPGGRTCQLARRRDLDDADLAAGLLAGCFSPSDLAAAVLARLFVVLARAVPVFAVPDLLLADDRLPADWLEPELPAPLLGWR